MKKYIDEIQESARIIDAIADKLLEDHVELMDENKALQYAISEKERQIAFLKDSHDAIRELAYKTGVEAEREACARVCEETTASWSQYLYNEGCVDCAKAIRARGEK